MTNPSPENIEISTSRLLPNWLQSHPASLVFSTYQVGKVFILGLDAQGKIHITERTFPRCMGLGTNGQSLWMSSLFQLWRFENSLLEGQRYQDYDSVLIPQVAYTTGDLDIHDICIGENGKPFFVNTRFSCLATISETHSFRPIWKPPFISKILPEDRCHLNGLADEGGKPRYVTMVSQSDVADGWRDRRQDGGIVMDVESNEVVGTGFSMPHSPRLYQGKLWLLEAGSGYFGYLDLNTNQFERLVFCPGFLRGLDFVDNYAIVGSSGLRNNKTFAGLELEANLKKAGAEARAGLHIINLETGAIEHWVRLGGLVEELYDVRVLPKVRKALLIGVKKDEIRNMISIEE